ncbi:hypothetical protein NKH36_26985 [Mesorhizobium sp. M1312]|uniref:hypothetical protein n=1 Tax=unclassified Mesorhizobium TaxID=325217 RepID=UPI0033369D6D
MHDRNAPANEEIIRLDNHRPAPGRRRVIEHWFKRQHVRQSRDDLAHYLVLQTKDVGQIAVNRSAQRHLFIVASVR